MVCAPVLYVRRILRKVIFLHSKVKSSYLICRIINKTVFVKPNEAVAVISLPSPSGGRGTALGAVDEDVLVT